MRKAVAGHSAYTKMALYGCGVDRHLFGLKRMAMENCIPIPDFYLSPGVVKSFHFKVFTSQVASKFPAFMCYGPTFEDSYAVCYNPRECDMIMAVSAMTNKETDCQKFYNALEEALDSMWEVFCRVERKKEEANNKNKSKKK